MIHLDGHENLESHASLANQEILENQENQETHGDLRTLIPTTDQLKDQTNHPHVDFWKIGLVQIVLTQDFSGEGICKESLD